MLILLIWALFFLASCGGKPQNLPIVPVVESVSPQNTIPGEIRVTGKNFINGSKVRVNGESFPTVYESGALKANIAGFQTAEPGRYSVSVEAPNGNLSNSVELSLLPANPMPLIKEIYPASIRAGELFNVQPNGKSAIGVAGANFLWDSVVEVDGKPMLTSVGDSFSMSAYLEENFFKKPGRLKITVRNKDGKVSLPMELPVNP